MSTASIEITHPETYFPAPHLGDFRDFEMSPTDNVLSEPLPIPLLQVGHGLSLYFDVPAFQLQLAIPIIEIESDMDSGRAVFKAAIDEDALLILTGTGKLNEEGDSFKIEHVNLHMERLVETARADFIVSTVRAALVLADDIHVRIPSIQLDITLRFDEPLLDISQMLRRRQIDYRIMVIERTVGHEFHLPLDITGDEVRDIALVYHAIVDSSFVWPINSITLFFPAAREWADTLTRLRRETSIPIGPDPFSLELFEHQIELGQRGIIIQDAVIENYETVQSEMSKDDGQVVPVVIRSTSGQARYDFFGVPKPPAVMWNPKIQRLIELESQLDATLVERYHVLAASTLEGLTEEEKIAITARPELDAQAF
ncbi:MAG: hypothetical protein ACR2G4_07450 [Pyrinomonadaceae bacterium]